MELQNSAAWLSDKKSKPLEVRQAPYTPPGAAEIVVKNGAVAINPVDWAKQLMGNVLLSFIKYPFILGGDVAGEVVEVGHDVQRFRVGDRVLGHALAGTPGSNKPAEGGFQRYTVIREPFAATIPEWVSYEQACVLPLTLSTAAYGLFHKDFLELDSTPDVPPPKLTAAGTKTIVITGASSSVGCNAVQLAVSAGYEVYATASPKNFAYIKSLGAARMFDYHSATIVDDMVTALHGKTIAGAYAAIGGIKTCIRILSRCDNGKNCKKFVTVAGIPLHAQKIATHTGLVMFIVSTIWSTMQNLAESYFTGVKTRWIDGKDLLEEDNVVCRLVYREFLPRALAARQFVPAPEPLIVGRGLEKIQEAMDVQAKGVSAEKVVVSL